jgi:ankyrin repeat protein
MDGIWRTAREGDLAEIERLVGHDPGLLDAKDGAGMTPLMWASREGHMAVVRWLLDGGAVVSERSSTECTPLWLACCSGRLRMIRLLMERGADPTIVNREGWTPLMAASEKGHLEAVRLLLGHPSGKATLNHRGSFGTTALWEACFMGHGMVARALLESGADPTIAVNGRTCPMAVAKMDVDSEVISAEGRRECVAALEVRICLPLSALLLWSAF